MSCIKCISWLKFTLISSVKHVMFSHSKFLQKTSYKMLHLSLPFSFIPYGSPVTVFLLQAASYFPIKEREPGNTGIDCFTSDFKPQENGTFFIWEKKRPFISANLFLHGYVVSFESLVKFKLFQFKCRQYGSPS